MEAVVVEGFDVKDCPHCGSEAHLKSDHGTFSVPNSTRTVSTAAWYWVKCSNRDCAASQLSQKTPEKAVEAWNQRAA